MAGMSRRSRKHAPDADVGVYVGAGEPLGIAAGVLGPGQQHSFLLAGHVAVASKRSSNSLAAWTTNSILRSSWSAGIPPE